MTLRPHIFTFYSYKGGVGRSMALLNVAYTLHSLGRHVLVVDLDLEAPGVSGFLRRNEELAPSSEDQPDVVDLMSDLMPALQWGFEEGRPELPVLEKYLRSVRADGEKFAPARNPRFRRTRLDVLCASDERDYAGRLGMLDLSKLSGEELVGAGNLLREVFFSHQFPWAWEENEEDQPTRYDYILIDSRTGFTETSGLCIGPLADRLVLFCGLNDQNINGTAEFLKVVGLEASSKGEKWDDDDEEDGAHTASLGQKPTLLVASPVPFGEMEMKAARFAKMEETLGAAPDARISYHPRLSIIETVFCRDGAAESINQEYEDITIRLLAMVGDHPDQWERRNESFGREKTLDLRSLRRFASLMEDENVRRIAIPHARAADLLSAQANQKTGMEANALFTAAEEKYHAALAIKPDFHEAISNWGAALSDRAKQKTGTEAAALFAAAEVKYKAALAIKPDFYEAVFNWGSTLTDWAKRKTGPEADALFAAAGEKYEAALAIKPDFHEALFNWGITLTDQAEQKTGVEADALLASAGQKYEMSLIIFPHDHRVLNNWGIVLTDRAKRKSGPEADILFAAAGEKYEAALAIKPDNFAALNNWGIALADQAEQKTGPEAAALFTAAQEKYEAALEIKPDDHEVFYNLACLHAQKRDLAFCLDCLSRAKDCNQGYLKQEKLDQDTDFDPVRLEPAFIAFRESLPAKE